MLKIVPDPPRTSLEDTLIQITEHLNGAHSVAQQALLGTPRPPEHGLNLATLHEIERAQLLVEFALNKLQTH
ncbi:hypothetical protein [Pseudomonas fontis]|uniref:Uncharacterized protein n=1 Tax=Pseudomonas fontis TaxID=2942633 RepID=A0ABT5NYW4_9PSED|nr:hypothetical protein [Pseudomonas fontis]MDD0977314.1 hypothetical protein [Pseudomonas fontis]MDD0993387.1 hypothetical protein [Pseudomonas fontis]